MEIDIPVEEKVDVGLDLPTPHVQEPEDSTPIEPDPVETDLDITPKTYPAGNGNRLNGSNPHGTK